MIIKKLLKTQFMKYKYWSDELNSCSTDCSEVFYGWSDER